MITTPWISERNFSLRFEKLGPLHVGFWLHTEVDPARDEWDRAFTAIRAYNALHSLETTQLRGFVLSDGGAPDLAARQQLGLLMQAKCCCITSVLTNPLKRGIATALNWVNPRMLFVEPDRALRAFSHLDLGHEVSTVLGIFDEMQRGRPWNSTLASVKRLHGVDPRLPPASSVRTQTS